ncbi:MAG: hypothetical protein KKD33_09500 [Verrucomicrobia bacterium]|nr:hypothetical protein [Verrucomicrobiota bacterium]MBU4285670.1 hypothetical protein [Verrucomicrobiota bacterium]
MPGEMHKVMGELSWKSLSKEDQDLWDLSTAIPDEAPEFIRNLPQPKNVMEKTGYYSLFLDLMGWRKCNFLKTPEYMLSDERPVPHGYADCDMNMCMTSEHCADAESTRRILRQFVPRLVASIHSHRMEEAALWGGLLAHFIQDGSALGHIFPNAMFYDFSTEGKNHLHYHSLIDGCEPELETEQPALLGESESELIFRLAMIGEKNLVTAKRSFFSMLEACRAGDRKTMNKLARPLMQSAVFQVASLFHSTLALGLNRVKKEEAEKLKSFRLVEAEGHYHHPGGKYGHIMKGHNVVKGKKVALYIDCGNGNERRVEGFGMTSFVSVRYLLEPGVFDRLEGAVGLSSRYRHDQTPDMEVEFFIGVDKRYNRRVSGELDYGPGMKKVFSTALKAGNPPRAFSAVVTGAKTVFLCAVSGLKSEKYNYPHIVVVDPRLGKKR